MNVLLIYPKFPDTFWSFTYALKFIRKKAAYPPLGLLTVAAMLPDEFHRRLVDVNVDCLTDDDLAWADLAFVGAMAVQRDSAKQIISRCKATGLKVIAGGPLFTSEPDAFEEVDHLVLDEAELTLPSFIEDLKNGHPKKIYRASGFCELHHTPSPAWDLIDMKKYASMSIQFSRGCPFNCDFCNVTVLFGRRPRLKSAQQVIAELDLMYDAGWRSNIFFVDDNFIGNKRYLKTHLLPALIQWRKDKKGCVFFTEASINLADDAELLDLMATAGFDSVFIGIETPNNDSLTECQKIQNKNRDLINDVKIIQRAGLQVQGGFIVGFDSDSRSTFQQLVDFIQKSGIVTAMVGLLQAPPGTRLFDRLKKDNRLLGQTISGLFPQALLPAGKSIPQRIRQFQGGHTDRSSKIFCVFPFQLSTGNPGQRAFPFLVFNDLDAGAQTQTASPGHHSCHIRPSLPENMRDTHSLSRGVNYTLKPADIYREQIRIYHEWIL
jgi:radical SAM superfamily enzyme YgiQ (UPF0313 family)